MSVQTSAKHHGTGLIIPLSIFSKNETAQEKPHVLEKRIYDSPTVTNNPQGRDISDTRNKRLTKSVSKVRVRDDRKNGGRMWKTKEGEKGHNGGEKSTVGPDVTGVPI